MRPGDRVTTTAGPGTITRIHTNTEWVFGRPRHTVWVHVTLDRTNRNHAFLTDEIQEDPMETTSPDTTHEVDPTQPDPQPEPTEPASDEPEPDTNNDDDKEHPNTKDTRRIIIEDEIELVEWP